MFEIVKSNYPNEVATMLQPWSVHIGHGYKERPQNLFQVLQVGMLHFTGIGTGDSYYSDEGIIKFCRRGRSCYTESGDVNLFDQSWGRADHYGVINFKRQVLKQNNEEITR